MNNRYVIPSLERAFQVLDLLAAEQKGITLAELVRRSAIPKSTLFRILLTLKKHHAVVMDESLRSYRLGSRLWELGLCFLDQSDLYQASSRYMKTLAELSGETVFMGTLEDGEVIYLRRMESPKSITVVKKLRQRVPAHCTATGMAMLAYLPKAEQDAILEEHGLTAYTDATITDSEAFRDRLAQIRREEVAVVNGEYNQELLCVSAPIFDHSQRPCASLTVAMIASQVVDQSRINTIADLVRQGARDFSREIGYTKDVST